MKKILVLMLFSFVSLASVGCQGGGGGSSSSGGQNGQAKSYNILGQRNVSFTVPGAPWVEKVQTVGEKDADLGMSADTVVGVTFRKGEADGLIAVGALGQQKDKSGKFVDLENDQETLNQIAMWVVKREGAISEQEYVQVDGVNAFRMVFEIKNGETQEKGEQIHFTKEGLHYTLSILVPANEFSSEVGQFRNLVNSFKTVPSEGAAPVATPSTTPAAN